MITRIETYVVHFYMNGIYQESHNETFTAKDADDFCKSFNTIQRQQVAVVEQCMTIAKPRKKRTI